MGALKKFVLIFCCIVLLGACSSTYTSIRSKGFADIGANVDIDLTGLKAINICRTSAFHRIHHVVGIYIDGEPVADLLNRSRVLIYVPFSSGNNVTFHFPQDNPIESIFHTSRGRVCRRLPVALDAEKGEIFLILSLSGLNYPAGYNYSETHWVASEVSKSVFFDNCGFDLSKKLKLATVP